MNSLLHYVAFRVVSAQRRFSPESFWPGLFRPESFQPGSFGPGSFRPILVGRFGPIFFKSPPRLRIIGRTIIWMFDEESIDVKGLLFKSLQFWGDR